MTVPHDRTADQFDAWLEAASQRHSRPSSPNGATDPAAYDLVATAHEFHASIRAAEQRAVPEIPVKAIWEDIMSSTTADRISIPALAPSGAGSPPNAPTHPTGDIGWPKPGHWAVPAFLVVAFMIGILWFYSSFFGSSTTPGQTPTLQPRFAFSTPTDDISEWLVDPTTYSCEDGFAATVTPESRPVDGWPTDRHMDVDDYLPMTNAPAADQRAIAERYLQVNTNCLPTSDDPVTSDDFHWMPGPSVATATAEQVETAQQISAALPMQDYRDYFILQPPSLGTPVPGESTSTMNGSGILLPQDVVQMADGRIGAPLRIVIESDDPDGAIHAMTGGRNLAPTVFMVFEWDGQRWLYDELFLLCIGDCDEYWAVVAGDLPADTLATPIAPPIASPTIATPSVSLQPITASECTVEGLPLDEVTETIRNTTEPPLRSWVPVVPVDPATADQVSQTDRAWQACDAFGSIGQRSALQTDHLTTTGPELLGLDLVRTDEAARLWFERFDQRRDLGAAVLASMDTYLATTGLVLDTYGNGETLPFDQRISLPVPEAAVLLADGRIALPVSIPITPSAWQNFQSSDSETPFVYLPVHILTFDTESNT
jgi:hypothetical protein